MKLPGKTGFAQQREVGAVLPFHSLTLILLVVIWMFGCVFPAGAPRIIEMRKKEISGSGWPFLFLCLFVSFLYGWFQKHITIESE